MRYQLYSDGIDRYEFADRYGLERAESRAFAACYVVYRNVDVDFLLSYEARRSEVLRMRNLFWITERGERIGGVIMWPNYIEGLFLIPPANDLYGVLRLDDIPEAVGAEDQTTTIAVQSHHLHVRLRTDHELAQTRVVRPQVP